MCEDFSDVVMSVSWGPHYHFDPTLSKGSDL